MRMAVTRQRRIAASAIWSGRFAVFALVLGLVASASHRFALLGTIPYFWVLGIVLSLALLALVLAALGFARLWEFGDKGGKASLAGAVLSLLVLAPFGYAAWLVVANPRLNDISTDVDDPPGLTRLAGLRSPDMNRIGVMTREDGQLQQEAYPEITGRRYSFTADRTLDGVVAAAGQLGWAVVENRGWQEDAQSATVEIVASSFILGFPSDMAVRVTDEGETSYVDVRSLSRYGMHDLGSNAYRISALLRTLDRIMAGAVGI